jgi:restriction system protein
MSIIKGWLGEKTLTLGMWLCLNHRFYQRFHDVVVPSQNGTTQIDHILVSPFGIFVIETKNMAGWIFGSENQSQWTQTMGRQKYKFQNPLRQNYRHTMCLSEFLGLDHELFHSIVFFIGDATLKSTMPANVLDRRLASYVRNFSTVVFSESQVQEIAQSIRVLKADRTLNRVTHMQSLSERHSSTTLCPKCNSELSVKTAKKGPNAGNDFLACSAFPRCRFTRDL